MKLTLAGRVVWDGIVQLLETLGLTSDDKRMAEAMRDAQTRTQTKLFDEDWEEGDV